MSDTVRFGEIVPTVFLRAGAGALEQLVRVGVVNDGGAVKASVVVDSGAAKAETAIGEIPAGQSEHEVFVDEVTAALEVTFALKVGESVAETRSVPWRPPRHWTVHLVHLSHHDVGYTDLASHSVPEHDIWLDGVIDFAAETRDFPDQARYRIVVEQAWSIDHYLNHAAPARAAEMVKLMLAGDVEVTALFGNMTSELCGHETLARTAYHAFRLKRRHGIRIVSAEHNDVPGFCWGLSQVLIESGVKIFCPGLPLYWGWGGGPFPSFWDEAAIFGTDGVTGMPGAFWWEAPTGKRVLFWCNNRGCGGGIRASLPDLADRLAKLDEQGYPYDVIRSPVGGGGRDNAPYIPGYAYTVRDWNAKWAYPRLILSTNARFYDDFITKVPDDLPVVRGDLPGQDYPVGATSTAAATAVNRNTHADLPAAEALAAAAEAMTDYEYQAARIFDAYEDVLWHDEHTWGYHFPCGPAAKTSELEKALHADRAAALAHDVANKAMARIADHVRLDEEGIHLVVFNPLPRERSDLVSAPLREIDNCGSTMGLTEDENHPGEKYLRGFLLGDRWHVNPPEDIVAGKFDLVDVAAGRTVAYQIVDVASPMGPVPYAAQRMGIAAGGKRYGGFEKPLGLKRDIQFRAENVPPLGYRTYRLAGREDCPSPAGAAAATDTTIENEYYRVQVDPAAGHVVSIVDKDTGRELIDAAAAHPFGSLVVHDPAGQECVCSCRGVSPGERGPLCASMRIARTAEGHPAIEQTVTLHAGIKRIDFAVRILKDPTPLLTAALSFPFAVPDGRFRLNGPLAVVDPARDLLPGAFVNRLTVQDWVKVTDGGVSVLWAALDAPIVSLGRLWPTRVSPAHSSVVQDNLADPPQKPEDVRGGAIYSCVFANNFATNFSVSQSGDVLFRYVITSCAGDVSDAAASDFGRRAATPLTQIFTRHPRPRPLPPTASFLELAGDGVQLLACKRAEDGRGLIIRLWNVTPAPVDARVRLPHVDISKAIQTNLAEEDTDHTHQHDAHEIRLALAPGQLATLRVL